MYQRFVRAKVRSTFEKINSGDYMAMVDGLAPSFEYRFHGDHALGGRRTSRDAMIRWWQRVMKLLPGVRFDVHDVLVSGGPWRTMVAVRSSVSGDLPGGIRYENTVFQLMTLVWGKVTSVETIEDLQILERALRAVAETGEAEAVAGPIDG
ncbi:nuclear transport factor 2 family protein [Pseudoclavibacter endophyticus]|uniref:Nuclear transport factor 2 family protein n=2 Tax=Pseudoclavibacter endophyticus TaxID=1778590 RepID=A0A6H9WFP9_9MICO|nr:nuclear transport factor 2 family protein [Pseudoclavibacter endophyticus]